MQSVNHPMYTYDSTGRLINFTPSGASNDVVAEHVLLDPRVQSPRSLSAGGLYPTVLNSPQLFTPPLSMTSPPVVREKTLASQFGYAAYKDVPETSDIYTITSAKPFLAPGETQARFR